MTAIVSSKATAEEAAAYKQWLLRPHRPLPMPPRKAASWASALQVSEGEQNMLDQLRVTIGA